MIYTIKEIITADKYKLDDSVGHEIIAYATSTFAVGDVVLVVSGLIIKKVALDKPQVYYV